MCEYHRSLKDTPQSGGSIKEMRNVNKDHLGDDYRLVKVSSKILSIRQILQLACKGVARVMAQMF